jgi:hypothetical protein
MKMKDYAKDTMTKDKKIVKSVAKAVTKKVAAKKKGK